MTVLEVRGIGKAYRSYGSELRRVLSWFGIPVSPAEERWVLRDVSFSISAGEAIGIIGQNGAGKSTLLKLITGTQRPTTGEVLVGGRVAAILELGMGFNPEFTGRQNAYHGLGLMGYSHEEIEGVMPALEEFAEVGEYFDQPVRKYSSGMQMRVAFAVVTAFRPEILIIDEALAVGDSYFQHKSFNRITEIQKQGTTLLIVSHDRNAIQRLCDRAILLEEGAVIKDGDPEAVFDFYNAIIAEKEETTIEQRVSHGRVETISGTSEAVFTDISLHDSGGNRTDVVKIGEVVELRFLVAINKDIKRLVMGCGIKDRLGQLMFGTNTWHMGQPVEAPRAGETYLFKVGFAVNLGVGSYSVHCSLVETYSHVEKNYEWRDGSLVFNVVNVDKDQVVGCMWNKMDFIIENVTDQVAGHVYEQRVADDRG